ncbi:heparinase II/III family protein [Phenylobacterium sp.]|uniref:heparinase II/III family protein n=1 Tax=Phenylobacterium sp. TaxID=1871053 RepID=UPI0035AE1058
MAGPPPAISDHPAALWGQALLHGLARQARRDWAGSPLHRAMLARPRPEGLAMSGPRDLRPADAQIGRGVLAGRYVFSGVVLEVGAGGDPWDRPSPSHGFAVGLHGFDWMRDLLAVGDEGAVEALRLTQGWQALFGKWNAFSWSPEVLERRVLHMACGVRAMAGQASETQTAQLALDLARQARHLVSLAEGPARAAERACVSAIAGLALSGEAGERLTEKALMRLTSALPVTVLPDGGHASRCPRAALELLLDLRILDEALTRRGWPTPDEALRAIDRLAGAVRFFTLADGALPELQGGEAGSGRYVAAARASADPAAGKPPAARNGYHRMESANLQVVVDAAAPAGGPWSVTACAQPLALEVLAEGRRMIAASAWSPEASGPPALRLVDASSTLSLADQPCGEPLRGFRARALGPRLVGACAHVEAARHEAEGAVWLELAHDGWVRRFGLRHERRLYLDLAADELRGEDVLVPAHAGELGEAGRRFIPYKVRFHVHPDVAASLARDGKSVLLRSGEDHHGWWLRSDAHSADIETSVYFEEGKPRRTQQIVLMGQARADSGGKLRWKLASAAPGKG